MESNITIQLPKITVENKGVTRAINSLKKHLSSIVQNNFVEKSSNGISKPKIKEKNTNNTNITNTTQFIKTNEDAVDKLTSINSTLKQILGVTKSNSFDRNSKSKDDVREDTSKWDKLKDTLKGGFKKIGESLDRGGSSLFKSLGMLAGLYALKEFLNGDYLKSAGLAFAALAGFIGPFRTLKLAFKGLSFTVKGIGKTLSLLGKGTKKLADIFGITDKAKDVAKTATQAVKNKANTVAEATKGTIKNVSEKGKELAKTGLEKGKDIAKTGLEKGKDIAKTTGKTVGKFAKTGGKLLGAGLRGISKAAGPLGLIMSAGFAAKDAVDGFNDEKLHQKFFNLKEGEKASVQQKLGAAMGNATAGLVNWVGSLGDMMGLNTLFGVDSLESLITDKVGGAVANWGKKLCDFFTHPIDNTIKWFENNIMSGVDENDSITTKVSKMAGNVIGLIGSWLMKPLTSLLSMFGLDSVFGATDEKPLTEIVKEKYTEIGTKFSTALIDFISHPIDSISNLFKELGFDETLKSITNLKNKLVASITNGITDSINKIKQGIDSFIDKLKGIWDTVKSYIPFLGDSDKGKVRKSDSVYEDHIFMNQFGQQEVNEKKINETASTIATNMTSDQRKKLLEQEAETLVMKNADGSFTRVTDKETIEDYRKNGNPNIVKVGSLNSESEEFKSVTQSLVAENIRARATQLANRENASGVGSSLYEENLQYEREVRDISAVALSDRKGTISNILESVDLTPPPAPKAKPKEEKKQETAEAVKKSEPPTITPVEEKKQNKEEVKTAPSNITPVSDSNLKSQPMTAALQRGAGIYKEYLDKARGVQAQTFQTSELRQDNPIVPRGASFDDVFRETLKGPISKEHLETTKANAGNNINNVAPITNNYNYSPVTNTTNNIKSSNAYVNGGGSNMNILS